MQYKQRAECDMFPCVPQMIPSYNAYAPAPDTHSPVRSSANSLEHFTIGWIKPLPVRGGVPCIKADTRGLAITGREIQWADMRRVTKKRAMG